ncbi:papain family cysteine protease, partial [Teladorsagia circumcincta]
CQGGWPIKAWQYFASEGIVTGGNYRKKDCCRPYEVAPCGKHKGEPFYRECYDLEDTPKCQKSCQSGYGKSYKEDKHYGKSAYQLPNSVKAIQREIMKNGPVVAGFVVYEDFVYYTSGIYKHTAGRPTGGHAVKIIGWGKENGTPYWIIANSWHNDWGEEGFYRMIRGINDCGLEGNVWAGLVQ